MRVYGECVICVDGKPRGMFVDIRQGQWVFLMEIRSEEGLPEPFDHKILVLMRSSAIRGVVQYHRASKRVWQTTERVIAEHGTCGKSETEAGRFVVALAEELWTCLAPIHFRKIRQIEYLHHKTDPLFSIPYLRRKVDADTGKPL